MFMKHLFSAAFLSIATLSATPVWQLGVPDGSGREFMQYSSREFQTSQELLNSSAYDIASETFTYRITTSGMQTPVAIPPGLTGGTAGNRTPVRKLRLLWEEREAGFRELEFRIVYAADRDFRSHRLTPNENMDIDSGNWALPGIRVEAPGKRVTCQAVPNDLERFLEKQKEPLVVKLAFPVKPGENILELAETSGNTYGRVFHFDYLKLETIEEDRRPTPHAEFREHENFLTSSVYQVDDPAMAGVEFHNLEPNRSFKTRIAFVDYLGNDTAVHELDLSPDQDGFIRTAVAVPKGRSGHFRIRAFLENGTQLAETRIAGVRRIEPLNAEEVEASFIGLSGLSIPLYFVPDKNDYNTFLRGFETYARWQKALQIRHERLHSLNWHFVEPKEQEYHWEIWDKMIEYQKRNNIQVQLTLLGTPRWLLDRHFPNAAYQHVSEHYFAPPPDMSAWRTYCALVAQRYGDTVEEFEIWNEVSEQSLFWPHGTAEQYVELVREASRAIKQVRPEAKIVAETVWPRQDDFSHRLFELGIADYVDIHADHYMSDLRIEKSLRLLKKYAPHAPLIDNETHKEDPQNPLGQIDDASRLSAARNMLRNFFYANAQGIQRIYNFVLLGGTWRKWGIVGPDETPKFTFSVLKTLLNRTAGAKFDSYNRLSGSLELFIYRYDSPLRVEQNGGDFLVVLCNSGSKLETVMLPALTEEYRQIDLMDNSCTLPAPNRIIKLEIGADPVMLTGVDVAALKELAKLELTVGAESLRPGEPISVEISIPKGVRNAHLLLHRSDGIEKKIQMTGGERRKITMPLGAELLNSVVTLQITGELEFANRTLPMTRYCEYIVETHAPGTQLFPTLSTEHWRHWGKGKTEFVSKNALLEIDVDDAVGALTHRKRIGVVPGMRYMLNFRAGGTGILRVMAVGIDRTGKADVLTHNLLSEKLSEQPTEFRREWICPENVVAIEFHFYLHHTIGQFELDSPTFIRLHGEQPINRQLYKVNASATKPKWDGELTGFLPETFQDVSDHTMLPGKATPQFNASFAVAADRRTLYLGVKVRDKLHHPGSNARDAWQGDSVQIDIDLEDGNRQIPSVQFSFALLNDGMATYRHTILPAADIVPAYKVGENPEGIRCNITRHDDETRYEIAIAAEAIHPQLIFKPKTKLGFSLLVNQNDGNGRLGFLQWSAGIGRERDTRQFGELILPEVLEE